MGSWHVDASQWPIVYQSVEGTLTNAQFDDMLREASATVMRNEPYVAILDTTRVGGVSAYMRTRTEDWQRANQEHLRQYCRGTVYVISSPLMRFIVMSKLMITGLPTPYRVSSTVADALAWARGQLDSTTHAPS